MYLSTSQSLSSQPDLVTALARPDKIIRFQTDIQDLRSSFLQTIKEAAFLLYLGIGLFFLLSLISFDPEDASWTHSSSGSVTGNWCGVAGAWLADFSLAMTGLTAYLFPFLLASYAYRQYLGRKQFVDWIENGLRWMGLVTTIAAGAALADLHIARSPVNLPESSGGVIGQVLADIALDSFGIKQSSFLLLILFLAGISLYTGLSWLKVIDRLGALALWISNSLARLAANSRQNQENTAPTINHRLQDKDIIPPPTTPLEAGDRIKAAASMDMVTPESLAPSTQVEHTLTTPAARIASKPEKTGRPAQATPRSRLPSLELLKTETVRVKAYTQEALQTMADNVEKELNHFGVSVRVVSVHPGPVITRFELEPAVGVKGSRISNLSRDLARQLAVTSVRVVEVIEGKSVIGLEIPNREREMVLLGSVLASDAYVQSPHPLTLVLGKDISGHPVVANLARMPHVLVAGTTGSGKSVAINVMILSLLYKSSPSAVRLIMIDPKMLELSIYEDIPHLLAPVVTDMKEAANALRWCVAEMERRYKLMAKVGVRNLDGFNEKVRMAVAAGTPLRDPLWNPAMALEGDEAPELEPLPYIVIVIDELADMMMIVGKKVEELIARLAQKARAAGLHLILATPRPSVDVITGLIKANIPTRIAFQVSSRIDSRTILDQGGAEALLGNGDMLYLPPGSGYPVRAHGAFVSDEEVHHIVEFLKSTGTPDYIEDITRFNEESASGGSGASPSEESGSETDPLYDEAVRFVTESRKGSISSVQRRFKVGYNRAARMIEDMERAGIVSQADGNGSRQVLAPAPPSD